MNNERELIRKIMVALNRIDNIYDNVSRKTGVKANLIWVLYALDCEHPQSQKQICEEWLIPKTTLNTIVKELEKNGYATLEHISGQRREMNIRLTSSGQEYAKKMLSSFYEAERKAFHQIKDPVGFYEELQCFCESLDHNFLSLFSKTGE